VTVRELSPSELRALANEATVKVLSKRAPAGNAPATGAAPVPLEVEQEFEDWSTDWLPQLVADWVEAQCAAHNVPRVMAIAAAMSAMSVALQGKVSVEIRPGWREPISLYWLVCSPTGTMKSRVLDAAKAPLKAIEAAGVKEAKEQAKINRRTRALLEGRVKKLRGMHAAKGALTPDQISELGLSLIHI
jgi:replicative DNA helicase